MKPLCLIVLIGAASTAFAGQASGQTKAAASPAASAAASVRPAGGKEGTTITITYPEALADYPKALKAQIEDPGVHGYVIVHNAGVYVAWDDHRDSKYTVPATAAGDATKKNTYKLTIPAGVCGIVISPEQATVSNVPAGAVQGKGTTVVGQNVTTYPRKSSTTKVLSISLLGEKGKPARFSLACDKYTLSVKVTADPDLVQPLPGSSTVTATLMVRGPAQVEVAAKLSKPSNVNLLTPLAFEDVLFDTTFGTLAPPAPAKVRTGTDGSASVSVSSGQPGTAAVRGVALGVGDGRADVQFAAKVEPNQKKPAAAGPLVTSTAMADCSAEIQQRHQGIVSGMKGKPSHEIAQALVDSDAKNPSAAQCARKKGGGGGDDTVPAAGTTGDPALDGAAEDANQSGIKAPQKTIEDATFAPAVVTPQPNPPHSFPRKAVILGGVGAGAAAAILVAKGGGGGGSTTTGGTTGGGTTGGGTGGGGGTTPTFSPMTLNSPPDYGGDMNLQQQFSPSPNALCQGSDAKYGEKVTVTLNSSGSGTIALNDTPNFQRVYNVSGLTALNTTVNASGTFSFLGQPVPGTLSVTFSSTTSVTIRETTNYGSCSNTYSGTMSR